MQTTNLKPVTTYPSVVGGVLAKIRGQQGLLQEHLAQAVGVTQTTWSRIENGQSSIAAEHLRLAAWKLGLPPGDVLHYADRVVVDLQSRGVEVTATRNDESIKNAIALTAAVAFGALIIAVIIEGQRQSA